MKLANPKSKHPECFRDQSRTRQRFNQSFVKELALPPQKEKQKNLPCFAKIKSADTQTD
jgi:hypothetical protein